MRKSELKQIVKDVITEASVPGTTLDLDPKEMLLYQKTLDNLRTKGVKSQFAQQIAANLIRLVHRIGAKGAATTHNDSIIVALLSQKMMRQMENAGNNDKTETM